MYDVRIALQPAVWAMLMAAPLVVPAFAESVTPSGFVCRQATEFLEFCAETQGDDHRGWRYGNIEAAIWWYPPNPDIVASIATKPLDRPLKRDEALEQVLAIPSRYELELGGKIESYEDHVIGWPAETVVYAATDRGLPRVYMVTIFQLNDTLIRIGSIGAGPDLSPEHRQAHAAFLWAIRFSEKAD